MNEFTKEELLQLYESIESQMYEYRLDDNTFMRNLRNKIQSMIDNYCDHDGEIEKDLPAERCAKCNKMWE